VLRTVPSSNQLCVYLLGVFRIEFEAESIRLPTRKVEALLAYLILHPGPHAREKLATLFWGDSSDTAARGSLRKALTLLRKHISEDLIIADREIIQLNPSFPLWVDTNAFEVQARRLLSLSSPNSEQFNILQYQGDLLQDFYDDWILHLRENYRILYLDVLLRAVEQARAQSEYQLAIEYARKILAKDAANERAYQHLMFCYMTLGERNKALVQYDACQRALRDELAVEPTRETQALYTWIKQAGMETPSLAARVTNLPIPISSFVGRSRELAKIKQLLSNARLVTLTGTGGSGKTRLAIHAATDLIDAFKDGVWWVELAPLTEPTLVPATVAKALGIDSRSDQSLTETLKQYLRTKRLLLVLDNCEHMIEACAHLAEILLTFCANLKILTTSREALCLSGENVWLVPPLSLPKTRSITLLAACRRERDVLGTNCPTGLIRLLITAKQA
jgi:DNA-binding SARP family transcriptional activator